MEERNLEPPGCKSSPVFQFISSFFWFIDLFKYADEYFIGLFASCIVNIVAKSFTERSWQVNVCMFLLPAVMEFNPPK